MRGVDDRTARGLALGAHMLRFNDREQRFGAFTGMA